MLPVQAQFYPLLRQWLASPAGSESRNNIIRAANGTIITSQLGAVHSPPNDEVRLYYCSSQIDSPAEAACSTAGWETGRKVLSDANLQPSVNSTFTWCRVEVEAALLCCVLKA